MYKMLFLPQKLVHDISVFLQDQEHTTIPQESLKLFGCLGLDVVDEPAPDAFY